MVMNSSEDPWNSKDGESRTPAGESSLPNETQKFEDNFDLKNCRLPDSDDYIASLEKKLFKLKNSKQSGSEESAGKDLVSSLQEFRESCMVRLISSSTSALISTGDLDLDSPLPTLPAQWLRNHINPEKPLTVGEALELLKADYLQLNNVDSASESSEPEK